MAGYVVESSIATQLLANGTSDTVVVPSGQVQDDVVCVAVVGQNLTTASFTFPAGWNSVGTLPVVVTGGAVYYQKVGASPLANFTLTWSATREPVVITFIIRGLDITGATSCFGSMQSGSNTSNGTATAGAMTLTQDPQLVTLFAIGERQTEEAFLDASECVELKYYAPAPVSTASAALGFGYTYAKSTESPVYHAHGSGTGGQSAIVAICWVGDGTTTKVMPYPKKDTAALVFKDLGAHAGTTKTQFDPTLVSATPQISSITNVLSSTTINTIYNAATQAENTHEISTETSILGFQSNSGDSPNLILNGFTFSSAQDLSDSLLAFQATIDSATTDSSDNLGRLIGFEDNSNNVAFYLFHSSDSQLPKGVNTFLIDTGSTGGPNGATNAVTGYEIATLGAGSVDYSNITAIYQGWKPSNYNGIDASLGDLHTIGAFAMFGGDADNPISFTQLKRASRAGSLNTIKQLGDGLFLLLSDLDIGDGLTDMYWSSDNQSIELPGAYDYDTGNIQFQMDAASRTVTINPGAGKTCKFPATAMNFKNFHNIVFTSGTVSNAATILNATPTFTGSSITSWVFSGCKGYSGTIGTTLTSCSFNDLASGENAHFTIAGATQAALQAELSKLATNSLNTASTGLRVEFTGTGDVSLTLANTVFSGNTVDVHYNSTNASTLTLVLSGTSNPTTKAVSGSAVDVVFSNDKTFTVNIVDENNSALTGAELTILTTGTQTEQYHVETATASEDFTFTAPLGVNVDVQVYKPGYETFWDANRDLGSVNSSITATLRSIPAYEA